MNRFHPKPKYFCVTKITNSEKCTTWDEHNHELAKNFNKENFKRITKKDMKFYKTSDLI